jgi:putative Mg2+ transporter-C (MgtC) family protein
MRDDMEFPAWDDQLWLLLHVVLAIALGGLIGIEREFANKPAGFRTYMLVSGSAALFVGLAEQLVLRFDSAPSADPIRILEAIVTGVAFLGAGMIFHRERGGVEGLTTASSILLAAAVGVAVALDQMILALGVTALNLIVLRAMRLVERKAHARAAAAGQGGSQVKAGSDGVD